MDPQNSSAVPAYVASLLRTVGGMVGGYLIGKGYITAEQAPEIGGALLTIGIAVWSVVQKYNANKALQAAIAAPAGFSK